MPAPVVLDCAVEFESYVKGASKFKREIRKFKERREPWREAEGEER